MAFIFCMCQPWKFIGILRIQIQRNDFHLKIWIDAKVFHNKIRSFFQPHFPNHLIFCSSWLSGRRRFCFLSPWRKLSLSSRLLGDMNLDDVCFCGIQYPRGCCYQKLTVIINLYMWTLWAYFKIEWYNHFILDMIRNSL